MNSLDVFHYVVSVAVVVISLVIIGIGVMILLLLYEIRQTLHTARKAVDEVKRVKNVVTATVTKYFPFRKAFFQKR